MTSNPKISVTITSYVEPIYRTRMRQVQKRKPRLTVSKQVAQCIAAHLPHIEAAAGLKARSV